MRVIPLETPPGRRHAMPVIFLMVVGIIGSLLFRVVTDVPFISAPADLDPQEEVWNWRDSVETNGWAFLHVKLLEEAESKPTARVLHKGQPNSSTFRKIREAREPWDDAVVEAARRSGSTLDLIESALAKPEFRAGLKPFRSHWGGLHERLEAELAMALHRGDTDRARRAVAAAARLSALILREADGGDDYGLGARLQLAAAQWTLEILTADPENRVAAAGLAEEWAREFPVKEAAIRVLVQMTLNYSGGADWDGSLRHWKTSLQSRPNRTRRLLLKEARPIRDTAMLPAAFLEESPGMRAVARHEVPHPALLQFDTNRWGLLMVMPGWAWDFQRQEAESHRGDVFVSRAMRVALAAWLWGIDHAGKLPTTLAELVPDYLPELPADPWNGGALEWDGAWGVIKGQGCDWKPGGYSPKPLNLGRLNIEGEAPWVRLPVPAVPAPPPTVGLH